MHSHLFILIKSFVKNSLDNYVVPGTLTGSEILWLYMGEWKRNVYTCIFASYFLTASSLKLRNFRIPFLPAELEDNLGKAA